MGAGVDSFEILRLRRAFPCSAFRIPLPMVTLTTQITADWSPPTFGVHFPCFAFRVPCLLFLGLPSQLKELPQSGQETLFRCSTWRDRLSGPERVDFCFHYRSSCGQRFT